MRDTTVPRFGWPTISHFYRPKPSKSDTNPLVVIFKNERIRTQNLNYEDKHDLEEIHFNRFHDQKI